MVPLIVSIITLVIAVLTAFAVVFKDHRRLSHIAFSFGMLSAASAIAGDAVIVFSPDLLTQWKRVVCVSEVIMVFSWLLFAVSFAREGSWSTVSKFSRAFIFASPLLIVFPLAVPADDFFYSPEFETEKMLFLGNAGYAFNLLLLLYSILAIIHLEITLKSSTGKTRWYLKYTLIGVGGILAMNIFYYSHALLYRSLNLNLLPVRTGIFLVSTIVIVFSIIRYKKMNVQVSVSRQVIYRSIALFIVGLYLLGLGLIGQGLRYVSPEMGNHIAAFLGFLGAIVVLVVILSEKLRRKVIVTINKNFYSQKYDYREQWLKFTQRISLKNNVDELLDSIGEGFMDAIRARGFAIWLRESGNGKFTCVMERHFSMGGWEPDQKTISYLKDRKWIINSHDPHCREVTENCAEIWSDATIFFIVPFLNLQHLIGFIVLKDSDETADYNYEDYDLLKTLARQASAAILNARLSEELTEAKEMEAMGRVSSFIIHDLKNAASMLSLIAQNAEEHIDNPAFQKDAVRTVINSAEKIKSIIAKLRTIPQKTSLNLTTADLGKCVASSVREIIVNGKTRFSYEERERVQAKFDVKEITKVISNLIINALDATDADGEITIESGREENMGFVRVSDNGCGMSQEFIDHSLFKPFQTTKNNGLGIGLYQCKTIVEAHAGKLRVSSREGEGSQFTLYLPLIAD